MSDEAPVIRRRRAPFLPSLIAAAAVLVWVIFVGVFVTLTGLGNLPFSDRLAGLLDLTTLVHVAFAAGILLSFWLLGPIVGGLRVSGLIVRALLAVAVGAVLAFPVEFAVYSTYFAQIAQQQDGASSSGLVDVSPAPGALDALASGAVAALQVAVSRFPLVVLAALGSWAWQRRSSARGQEA
jgi:hypothetical protein